MWLFIFWGLFTKNYFDHNEVLLVLHPFTHYFLEQCLQIRIHKKLTNLEDGNNITLWIITLHFLLHYNYITFS